MSVVLIREHGGTHLAETAPPGIIFPLHAYIFSDFRMKAPRLGHLNLKTSWLEHLERQLSKGVGPVATAEWCVKLRNQVYGARW